MSFLCHSTGKQTIDLAQYCLAYALLNNKMVQFWRQYVNFVAWSSNEGKRKQISFLAYEATVTGIVGRMDDPSNWMVLFGFIL